MRMKCLRMIQKRFNKHHRRQSHPIKRIRIPSLIEWCLWWWPVRRIGRITTSFQHSPCSREGKSFPSVITHLWCKTSPFSNFPYPTKWWQEGQARLSQSRSSKYSKMRTATVTLLSWMGEKWWCFLRDLTTMNCWVMGSSKRRMRTWRIRVWMRMIPADFS